MFDFPNYTYSGILSILSTLFGLSYPLVIGCIEKIDDKYGSTLLSERFQDEPILKWFKASLVINLVMAVLFPFLMDGSTHARIIIGLQCVGAIVLVSCALLLFSKIIYYYIPNNLQKEITDDYEKAINMKDKDEEEKYFTQWVDLSGVLLKSADDKIVQSVYEVLSKYVERVDEENKENESSEDMDHEEIREELDMRR